MLDGSELYVILKLISGESVMAVLKQEDDDRVLLETPMVMRSIPIFELGREQITASPLCSFSDDKCFVIHKKDIMFCKKLHHVFIPHYQKIVAEQEKQAFISNGVKQSISESISTEEHMNAEEIRKIISSLENIASEKEDKFVNFIQGNDTIN